MTETTTLSHCIGQYVENGVLALKDDVLTELTQHGKACVTFRVKYRQTVSGEIEVDIERRLAHSADVVKTSVGRLQQPALPGM